MRAYSFRLEAVLRVRRIQALLARESVASAARALGTAAKQEQVLTKTYEAGINPSGDIDAAAFIAAQEHGARLAEMLAKATEARARREARLLSARCEALSTQQRVAVLERLGDRRRHEWLIAVQREDSAVLDDFATVRAAADSMEAARAD